MNKKKILRAKLRPPKEHDIQTALIKWAGMASAAIPELGLLLAIPNGGDRHPAVAARLRAEGVRRGVPDLFLPVARRGHHGLFIELKRPGGYPTKEQKEWLKTLTFEGYRAVCCKGFDEAKNELESYLKKNVYDD